MTPEYMHHTWEVLLLFLIPVGGGIPAGVILAQKYGIAWPIMGVLYFISDIVLACVFEVLMLAFLKVVKEAPWMKRVREAFALSTQKILAKYGGKPSFLSLVMISFGTDPMTGRSVAKAVGHGFLSGWLIVIIGDMFFFTIIMVSTLWLGSVLGDGTWAAVIITLIVLFAPALVRRIRKNPNPPPNS